MAVLVKWLTHQIVALACKGSTPLYRPIYGKIKPFGLFDIKKLGISIGNPSFLHIKDLIKFIRYKYRNSNYDYSILIGVSNVDGKSVDYKYKSKAIGRSSYEFMSKNIGKGIRFVNWHLHIMVCGAPLGTMVRDIEDYLQRILNKKLSNKEFDKKIYDSSNFNKYYFSSCKKELDVLMSGLLRKRKSPKERVPKCSLINLNVNRRKTRNRKEDYEHIINYIEKQSVLTQVIENKGFSVAYFNIAKELNC